MCSQRCRRLRSRERLRRRRERTAAPLGDPEPTLHREPEFCNDESPGYRRLREAVQNYVSEGGRIKRYGAQAEPVLNLDGESVHILDDEVLRNGDYGIYWN